MDSHPELRARSVIKRHWYATALKDLLVSRDAGYETAAVAAEIELTAYYVGRAIANNDPEHMSGAVELAFDRLI